MSKLNGNAAPKSRRGSKPAHPMPSSPPNRQTKKSQLLSLLQREEGATLVEMVATTDWLPHTMRATLTAFRKAGHTIDKSKRGDVTCYHIVEAVK